MGRGCRPDWRRSWYSTFAPFPDTPPRNQPALGQAYATVVRGANVNCQAWLMDDSNSCSLQSIVPANSLPRVGPAAGCRCSKQHERCVNIAHVNIVTLRYTKPGPSARYKDGSSGGAASSCECLHGLCGDVRHWVALQCILCSVGAIQHVSHRIKCRDINSVACCVLIRIIYLRWKWYSVLLFSQSRASSISGKLSYYWSMFGGQSCR